MFQESLLASVVFSLKKARGFLSKLSPKPAQTCPKKLGHIYNFALLGGRILFVE